MRLSRKKKRALLGSLTAFAVVFSVLILPFFNRNGNGEVKNVVAQEVSYGQFDFRGEMPINAARCAIVIDAESGNILFSKNADEKRGMASTTKIMTALVAIENCNVDKEFLIPKEAVGIEGSSVYLKENEPLTLKELLYCLMLESGNDAATAIAFCVGGSVEAFCEIMNSRAEEMGLKNTNFKNPHGLSDEEHFTTARELALITAEAMKYELFREIVSTKRYSVRYDGAKNGRSLVNHNKLLFNYEGAVGVKTGYTKKDGKCLVSAATKNGLTLIAVTLNDSFPTATHQAMLNAGFEQFEYKKLASAGDIVAEIPIAEAEQGFVRAENYNDIYLCLPKNAEIKTELFIPEDLIAPIDENDIIASAKIIYNQQELYIINLESTETVAKKRYSFFEKIFGD